MSAEDTIESKPFLDHLEELRQTIIRCAVALALGVAICIPLAPQILQFLKAPLDHVVEDPDRFLRSLQVAGAFTLTMRIAFWSGLLLSISFIMGFIGVFVFPGLTRIEKKVIFQTSGFALVLFFLGVALGYFITLRVALQVMLGLHDWLGIEAQWIVSSYITFVIQLLIAFGLAFEMPVIVWILGRLGVVTSDQLRRKRKHAAVIMLVTAMVLTPPDVFTQLMMAVPLMLLFEICIWLLRVSEKKARARLS